MSGVCTGACCVVFPIAIGGEYGTARDRIQAKADDDGDNAFIGNMIFPLTMDQARERWMAYNPGLEFPFSDKEEHFGCRHWDGQSRRCTEYARRPKMCSAYPYSYPGTCEFCGYRQPGQNWYWDKDANGYRLEEGKDPASVEVTDEWTWDGEIMRAK